jgi:hypothetical protein
VEVIKKRCKDCIYRTRFATLDYEGGTWGCGYMLQFGVRRERDEEGNCLTFAVRNASARRKLVEKRKAFSIKPQKTKDIPVPPDPYTGHRMYLQHMA